MQPKMILQSSSFTTMFSRKDTDYEGKQKSRYLSVPRFLLMAAVLAIPTTGWGEDPETAFQRFNATFVGNTWRAHWRSPKGFPIGVWGGIGYSGPTGPLTNALLPHTISSPVQNDPIAPSQPTLAPSFMPSQKLGIVTFYAQPLYLSLRRSAKNRSTDFMMLFAAEHTDELQPAEGHKDTGPQFDISWNISISGPQGIQAFEAGTTPVENSECLHGGNGGSCQWYGVGASSTWDPTGIPDGGYEFFLSADYERVGAQSKVISSATSERGLLVVDSTPPLLAFDPPDESVVTPYVDHITIMFSDETSGIDISSLRVWDGNAEVTGQLIRGEGEATLPLYPPLASGVYRIKASVSDLAGNSRTALARLIATDSVDESAISDAMGFLQQMAPVFGFPEDLSTLRVTNLETSVTAAKTLTLSEEVGGIPVYGAVLKVGIGSDNKPDSLWGFYYPEAETMSGEPFFEADDTKGPALAHAASIGITSPIWAAGDLEIYRSPTAPIYAWTCDIAEMAHGVVYPQQRAHIADNSGRYLRADLKTSAA